jgi:hypothetical protein
MMGFLALALSVVCAAVPPPREHNEVHVVCAYETTGNGTATGRAAVKVDRPGKSVTLVLAAYKAVAWEVAAAPRTNVIKVVLGGYEPQTVTGLPDGTTVVNAFRQARNGVPHVRGCYAVDSAGFRPLARAVHEITGQDLSSFQGTYRANPAVPFVVNRTQADLRLRADYPQPTPAAELPALEFQAVAVALDRPSRPRASYGTFTLAGPKAATLRPMANGVVHVAHDPATGRSFGLTKQDVIAIDWANNGYETITPEEKGPRLQGPTGITVDPKGSRVLVAAVENLYAYDLKTMTWAAVSGGRFARPLGLVYHAADDTLYGIDLRSNGSDSSLPYLVKYDQSGRVASTVRLREPMFPGILYQSSDCHMQMISAGQHLVVLVTLGLARPKEARPETYIFLVEPATGQVRLTWRSPER